MVDKHEVSLSGYTRNDREMVKQSLREELNFRLDNGIIQIVNNLPEYKESIVSKEVKGELKMETTKTFTLSGLSQQQVDELHLILGYVVPRNNSLLSIMCMLDDYVSKENYDNFDKVKIIRNEEIEDDFQITFQEEVTDKCVHTEHCCSLHGCKYGLDDCPVTTGKKKQSFPCEECETD